MRTQYFGEVDETLIPDAGAGWDLLRPKSAPSDFAQNEQAKNEHQVDPCWSVWEFADSSPQASYSLYYQPLWQPSLEVAMQMIGMALPGNKGNTVGSGLVPQVPERIIKRTRHGMQLSHFPSRKMGRVIRCESAIESDLALYFECDPNVVAYCEQPQTIALTVFDQHTYYTPDFMTEEADSSHTVWEVKPDDWLFSPYWVERLRQAKKAWEKQGFDYTVITASELRGTPYLSNLRLIYPRVEFIKPSDIFEVQEALAAMPGPVTVGQLLLEPAMQFDAIAAYVLQHCRKQLAVQPFNMKFILKGLTA